MQEVVLSTMWIRGRFDHLSDFLAAGREMGFQRFELNHMLTPSMLEGVAPGCYEIISVHDPCPRTMSWQRIREEGVLLSSLYERGRRRAVSMAKGTINLACRFGAQAVILHLGRVKADASLERELRDLYDQGLVGTERYAAIKERLMTARAAGRQEECLAAAVKSLREISRYAEERGIKLGVENRYYYLEVPDLIEMQTILGLFENSTVFYWHDTGHAQNLENLGFTEHEEWLKVFSSRMLGVHFHDIIGLKDHQAAGVGGVDFAMVASYLPHGIIRVCELDQHHSAAEIVAGVKYLAKMGCLSKK